MATLDPKSAAQSARQWSARLAAQSPAVLPDTPVLARDMLARSRISMAQLAQQLGRDPASVWHVLREANRFAANREMPIRDLAHALSLLGMERIRELIDRMPVCAEQTHEHYRRLLMISLHAGTLTTRLCELGQRDQPGESGWTAMIWLTPAWLLALDDPDTLQQLQQAPAERVLGCSWNSMVRPLFQQWKLDRLVEDTLAVREQMQPRQWAALARSNRTRRGAPISWQEDLRGLVYREGCYIELGNRIALSAAQSWYQRPAMRWQRAAGNLLGRPLSDTVALIHTQAAEAARESTDPGTVNPALKLLQPPAADSTRVRDQQPADLSAEPTRQPDPACLKEQAALLGSTRLQKIPQVLQVLMKALHMGLGLERVAIAGHTSKTRSVRVQASAGVADGEPLRGYQEQLQAGDLLSRLLNGDKGIWMRAENHARLAPMQPAGLVRIRQGDEFMAAPLRAGGRSLALVYADPGAQGTGFSELEYKRFCQLCARASMAIERIQSG